MRLTSKKHSVKQDKQAPETYSKTSYPDQHAGESLEKREPSCPVGGTVNGYSHYGEQYGVSLKTKIELPCDLSNPTSGHVP